MTPGHLEQAWRTELAELPEPLRKGVLAVSGLILARRVDAGLPPRELAPHLKELRATRSELLRLAPRAGQDKADELKTRRLRRIHQAGR